MTTKQFIAKANGSPIQGYNEFDYMSKEEWLKTGRRILRQLAKELGLQKKEYNVSINRAGVAVSGEITLHADWVYVQLGQSCLGPNWGFMWRLCDGQKDYTGKGNQWSRFETLNDLPSLAKTMIQHKNS